VTALGSAEVIRANSRNLPLDDNSVDLVVTSPPYFALRSYQDGGEHYDGQIGDEPTPAAFVESLLEVTRECVRVLKPTGSLFVNLGDKYARTGGGGGGSSDGATGRNGSTATIDGVEHASTRPSTRAIGAPEKSLIGIPWRYAIRCIDELGLVLRAELVWDKPNGLPESVTDRVRRSHETWFHFTLEPRYYSSVDAIRLPYAPDTAARYAIGYASRPATDAARLSTNTEIGGTYDANPLGKLPGSVWSVPTEPLKVPAELGVEHFAAFPTEWPKRLIAGWSPTGVCTACGQGRRPVTERGPEYAAFRASVGDFNPDRSSAAGKQRTNPSTVATDYRIVGEACQCNEPIATPLGTGGDPDGDPTLETGRAGLNRERAAGNGIRWISRHVQRHEATLLRSLAPEIRDELALEAGPTAFAHYTRTDVAGARPIPEHLRERWLARGILTPAPTYVAAPTTPAVVLDPFGGTGTTAMVAKALGRHGISVDMSADYCRLAEWRTNDRDQLARVLGIAKAPAVDPEQLDIFAALDGADAGQALTRGAPRPSGGIAMAAAKGRKCGTCGYRTQRPSGCERCSSTDLVKS
jgi:DNA modification methylase